MSIDLREKKGGKKGGRKVETERQKDKERKNDVRHTKGCLPYASDQGLNLHPRYLP